MTFRLATLSYLLLPSVAFAARVRLVEAEAPDISNRPLVMMAVLTLLALLPFAAVMLTSFSKIVVVLAIARSALGTQQAPPTIVLTGLAAVLSAAIMAPVGEQMWRIGQDSFSSTRSGADWVSSVERTSQPLREFLVRHGSAEQRWEFLQLARELRPEEHASQVTEEGLWVVIPAFILTELKEAFQVGFLVFLPFLVLDMVVANVLLALGMQTLPPGQVSLPFKLLLFVAVDGWALLARGLVQAYR